MPTLSKADLLKASNLIGTLYETTTIQEYAATICRCLPRVISTEFVSYNELDSINQRALVIMEPDTEVVMKRQASFEQTVATHPYMTHFLKYEDPRALRIDDVSSQREFFETPVYREFYKFISVRDQLVTFISSDSDLNIGIALTRSTSSFSPRDRDLLEFLRPHLFQAYKGALRFGVIQQQRRALEEALAKRNATFLMCLQNGEITYVSALAQELLAGWFAIREKTITRLPDPLDCFLSSGLHTLRTAQFSRSGKRLLVTGFPFEQQLCLCFSESLDPLEEFGLTPREMEVLEWLAEGKRNNEIGQILGISTGTVKRHVDHLLEKLCVETRTAAARTFHEARLAGRIKPQ